MPRRYQIPCENAFLKPFCRLAEWIFGLRKIDILHDGMAVLPPEMHFREKALVQLGVRYDFDRERLERLPKEGPLVVVANHPYGGIEGIILLSLLKRLRPDVKAMANYILGVFTEMKEDFILVDPFAGKGAVAANLRPIKESISWLKGGHVLIVFPAGEVSSLDLRRLRVRDKPWSPMIASIVRKTNATVVPLYLPGHNTLFFQLAGLIHPILRTILLPRQMLRLKGKVIRVEIGSPLPPKTYAPHAGDDKRLILYFRFRSYLLAERKKRRLVLKRALQQEPIVEPEPIQTLLDELAALPPERKLVDNGHLQVWCAPAKEIPHILHEIGRLREITFRMVGEGTGNSIDLDEYDPYYWHMFLWNNEKQEIIGCYRIGLTDEIVREHGIQGLYIRSLFKFDQRLLNTIGPFAEMGRSFVRTKYQRAITSLPLLWKGIAVFMARARRYRTLMGPVSITNEYRQASRCMMIRSLRHTCWMPELARLVSSRIPPKKPLRAEWSLPEYDTFLHNIDQVGEYVEEIEPNGYGIPILINQYLKLAGRLICFNLDPEFSSVVDGFIVVDLTQTPQRILKRYMGAELKGFYDYWHIPLENA